VNRGGSFNNAASNARSANRNNNTPENRDNNLGLRPSKATHRPIASAAPARSTGVARSCIPCRRGDLGGRIHERRYCAGDTVPEIQHRELQHCTPVFRFRDVAYRSNR
jgi:hypothetical protein